MRLHRRFETVLRRARREVMAYQTAKPLTERMLRYSSSEAVNAEYAPDAHPQKEALRWRREHQLGRTLSRSERRRYQRLDRRTRGIVLGA